MTMSSWFDKLAMRPQRSVLLLSLALMLAGNWILPLTDRDEARFAEASREMLQRADFIVPWFNGEWRFDKPVLIYWCQIGSFLLFGDNDFAARVPSAIFTALTALLLARWGRNAVGAKTGFMAGVIYVTAFHVLLIGRIATADMAMIFFVTLAVWSGWVLTRPGNQTRRIWWWIFYSALALGFLAKGSVAWLPLGGGDSRPCIEGEGFPPATERNCHRPLPHDCTGCSLGCASNGPNGWSVLVRWNGKACV